MEQPRKGYKLHITDIAGICTILTFVYNLIKAILKANHHNDD